MRIFLVVTLALSPAFLHAQTQSSALTHTQGPVLESKLVAPKAADGTPSPNLTRTTSTLLQPKLIKWANIKEDQRGPNDVLQNRERTFTLSMNVSNHGVPCDLKIVNSEDPLLNRNVLDAVAQYRFTPASLDSKPTAVAMMLTVHVVPQKQ